MSEIMMPYNEESLCNGCGKKGVSAIIDGKEYCPRCADEKGDISKDDIGEFGICEECGKEAHLEECSDHRLVGKGKKKKICVHCYEKLYYRYKRYIETGKGIPGDMGTFDRP